jgi:hypothetical protein
LRRPATNPSQHIHACAVRPFNSALLTCSADRPGTAAWHGMPCWSGWQTFQVQSCRWQLQLCLATCVARNVSSEYTVTTHRQHVDCAVKTPSHLYSQNRTTHLVHINSPSPCSSLLWCPFKHAIHSSGWVQPQVGAHIASNGYPTAQQQRRCVDSTTAADHDRCMDQ